MIDPLQSSMRTAASALEAQSVRMRIVSENIANADTTGLNPGDDPYTRKTISFADALQRSSGENLVAIRKIGQDSAPYRIVRDPGNPAADANGDVKMPNVDPMLEIADLREANRSYQANLQVVKQMRDLYAMTLDLLKS